MDNFDLKKYLAEGRLLKENALEKLADITFETAEEDTGSAVVYIEDFEGNESIFNKAYNTISKGTTTLSSGMYDYKFSIHKDNDGERYIKLSFNKK